MMQRFYHWTHATWIGIWVTISVGIFGDVYFTASFATWDFVPFTFFTTRLLAMGITVVIGGFCLTGFINEVGTKEDAK